MEFSRLPLSQAEGAILAHGLRLGERVLKKGRVLSAEDIALLAAAGQDSVIAARLSEGDIGEDAGAEKVAVAAAGPGLSVQPPHTGRSNIMAAADGLFTLSTPRLNRLNAINEAVTLATLPPYTAVSAGQMVATVKVIPFSAPDSAVGAAVAAAREPAPVLGLAPFRKLKIGLLTTILPGLKERVLEKAEQAVTDRLARMNNEAGRRIRSTHTEDGVADALRALRQDGCQLILIVGASAIVDRRDVIPTGIEHAGGAIDHFGMPVDPGNLLLLAHIGEIGVIGVPGCARSPKLNGFDWVLQRLIAGIGVGSEDIMAMGVGGLLKEAANRPFPRQPREPAKDTGGIAAIILAAGQSRRMGVDNKLLKDIDGKAMVAHVVEAARGAGADPIIVVTGHQHEAVEAALTGPGLTFVRNPDYARGLSTSLKAGMAALPANAAGALACLGDMPRISSAHLEKLINAFDPGEGRVICVPTKDGKRGNPVLWGARLFAEIAEIEGDVGARHLIGKYAELVCEVPIGDDAIFLDIDTPDALARARRQEDDASP